MDINEKVKLITELIEAASMNAFDDKSKHVHQKYQKVSNNYTKRI